MSRQDQEKWNARYRDGAYAERDHPAGIVAQWAPLLLAGIRRSDQAALPRALDVASGAGRNALWLAEAGFVVDAIDIAEAGLERARMLAGQRQLDVRWIAHDLDDGLPAGLDDYDLIVVIRYLNRTLLPLLPASLRPGGLLVCEVHLATDLAVVGPATSAFRAKPGELAQLLPGLDFEVLEEGVFDDPDGRPVALARAVGRRSR